MASSHERHQCNADGLRERAVVSSFICTSPQSPQGLNFALFKRSQHVNTYQGKWAVCSGSIDLTDATPQAAAKREICEETTLTGEDIFLLRRGKPFSLTDDALKTRWTIYPFAWQLRDGAKPIKFDWEHTEYRFVKPEDVASYDHVPQLEVGMNRVLFSPETEGFLTTLSKSKSSDPVDITTKALNLLLSSIQIGDLSKLTTSKDFWRELRWKAWHFVEDGDLETKVAMKSVLSAMLEAVISDVETDVEELPLEKVKAAAVDDILSRIRPAVAVIVRDQIEEVHDEVWEMIMSDL